MSSELRERVKAGELDVCFQFGTGVADAELQSEPIADETLVVIASSAHRLAQRSTVTMEDLLTEQFVVTEPGCVYRKMFDDAFVSSRPARPTLVGEFGSMAAIRALVEQGLGCAFVPKLIADQAIKEGAVVSLPHAAPRHCVPITMYWRARTEGRRAMQSFLDEARAGFREASH
jgi:DNA-binding transcriptional LysR family regulator